MNGDTLLWYGVLVLPAAVACAMAAFNATTWPRGTQWGAEEPVPTVSALVPARNEEAVIGATVAALLASTPPVSEVIVYDDASTDRTPDILATFTDPRLRVVRGNGLPAGWVGKPHACHQLGQHAKGEVLLFVDADTRVSADGVGRLLSLLCHPRWAADLVTAVPRQAAESWAEQLLMPLLHLVYVAWLPIVLVRASSHPALLAANGQLLMIRRSAYDTIGGFAAVKNEVVDDMAFCRRAKELGLSVWFADGHEMATTRMYSSGVEIWKGFSKNLYEGVGGHPLSLMGVIGLLLGTWVAPWMAMVYGFVVSVEVCFITGLLGAILGVLTRAILAVRHGHRAWSVVAHPFAVLGLVGIAVNSFLWSRRGQIVWAGRTYAARPRRGNG